MPWVQSLVKELRFPQVAKKKKKKMQVEQGSEGRAHPVWGGARGSSGCASQSGDPTKGPGRGDFNGT